MEYRGYRNIYGYKILIGLERYFVIDDLAAEVVRKIFQWVLDGKSIDEIVASLNNDGYLTPAEYARYIKGIMWEEEYIQRALWDSKMVRRILRNKMYTGMLEWDCRESYYENGRRKQRKRSNVKSDTDRKYHEHIVTTDEFMKVQKLLDAYSGVGKAQREKAYISLLTCGICGSRMKRRCASSSGKKYVYYRCSDKVIDGKKIKGCSSVSVREDVLEKRLKELGIDNNNRLDMIERFKKIKVYEEGEIGVL